MIKMIEIESEPKEKVSVLELLVRQMYDLLGANMTKIVGGQSPDWQSDANFSKWRNDVFLGEVHSNTNHLWLVDEKGLRGFLSYTAAPDTTEVYLNEVQIRPSCRSDSVTLRCLIRSLAERIQQLPHDQIRTYSNKANTEAHGLAEKAGFEKIGETERGYRYRMPKSQFLERFTAEGRQKNQIAES